MGFIPSFSLLKDGVISNLVEKIIEYLIDENNIEGIDHEKLKMVTVILLFIWTEYIFSGKF